MGYKIKGTWKMLGRQCVHAKCSKYMDVKTFDVDRFADFFLGFIGGLDVEEYCHDSRMCIELLLMFFAQAEFLLCRSFDRQFRQGKSS